MLNGGTKPADRRGRLGTDLRREEWTSDWIDCMPLFNEQYRTSCRWSSSYLTSDVVAHLTVRRSLPPSHALTYRLLETPRP